MSTLTMYGRPDCDDTDYVRGYLQQHQVPFTEVNIDNDADANSFVIFINRGNRVTPTLILDDSRVKMIMAEPNDRELDTLIQRLGTK